MMFPPFVPDHQMQPIFELQRQLRTLGGDVLSIPRATTAYVAVLLGDSSPDLPLPWNFKLIQMPAWRLCWI